ncbi:GNAT family N-acetyltransferase [Enterococcus casseliflavus]|uniref:GNAT family N-acetyltransferase n=1 Tax=Enterococcus casseliflavus TaxID=37734 RepID=UPI00224D219B|nr:GNAT family N-acetyltransferase [Enterococcus casseliflavus]MCX4167985.1 GNAT family N-acetyltransferase [Enterococcus casseliflavus]
MKNNEIQYLEWDSHFFNKKVGKLILSKENQNQFCENDFYRYDLIYIYNYQNDKEVNNFILEKFSNARLQDINVQLKRSSLNINENNSGIITDIKFIKEESIDLVISLSKGAFRYTRFFNDPLIPNELADIIYEQWLINSFKSEDSKMLGYYQNNILKGYILYKYENEKSIRIELIAVSKTSQNQGIASKLIDAMFYKVNEDLHHFEFLVGTQLNNIGALNLYISCGFKILDISSVYHWWKEDLF